MPECQASPVILAGREGIEVLPEFALTSMPLVLDVGLWAKWSALGTLVQGRPYK